MAPTKNRGLPGLLVFVLLLIEATLLLLPIPVLCKDEDEDNLLQGLNSYRSSLKIPPLNKNKQAGCLADELAEKMGSRPCIATTAANAVPAGSGSQITDDYQKFLKKCNIDQTKAVDGVILPVCVPKLVPTLVLTNYTRTGVARYINDSRYTGAGLGSEDDWMVVVLTTNTVGGSFASSAVSVGYELINYLLLSLFLGLLFLVY